jgi:predicted nicotinamide N-methyase
LAAYLANQYYSTTTPSTPSTTSTPTTSTTSSWNNEGVTLIDLGSGTGLVGLAVAALSRGRAAVAVTDLPEALAMLQENVNLNSKLWTTTSTDTTRSDKTTTTMPVLHTPVVHELTWGEPIADAWLEKLLSANNMPHTKKGASTSPKNASPNNASSHSHSRILLTGADIIYRPSLFRPLLSTLSELSARLHQLAPDAMVDCLLACQSRFSHLQDFWDAARRQNFGVDVLAVVRLSRDQKTDLSQATIEHVGGNVNGNGGSGGNKKMAVSPPSHSSNEEDDRVWIVRIHKLPYTFSI